MAEHSFAKYIRTLGRGKKGARSLSQTEAFDAMSMILNEQVRPEQLGAFLMLLRVKEESPEELAGFVLAIREKLHVKRSSQDVDLDWSSYAGKRRHLPWFILSSFLLAQNDITVFMHGTHGNKDNRIYTTDILKELNIPISKSLQQASLNIGKSNFAYCPLESFSPQLKSILNLRSVLGLRSPINTLLRIINPLDATHLIQGVFHPGYRNTHQQAATLLDQHSMAVFKGEGGEPERNPDTPCLVLSAKKGRQSQEEWPAQFHGRRHLKETDLSTKKLHAVWQGTADEYGEAAIIGTTAIALKLIKDLPSTEEALRLATSYWHNRDKTRFI